MQASTTSEEERLGLDFGQLWQDRQKADTLALVERESVPKEGAAPIKFDSEFAQGCALSARYSVSSLSGFLALAP